MGESYLEKGLQGFLNNFLDPKNRDVPILVFQNPQDLDFTQNLVSFIQGHQTYLFDDPELCCTPYGPFFLWSLQQLRSMTVEEQERELEHAKFYIFHKPLIKLLLDEKPLERPEEIFYPEIEFEQQMMLNALVRLFINLARLRPSNFVVDQAQIMNDSSYAFMRLLWKKVSKIQFIPFRIFLIYQNDFQQDSPSDHHKIRAFFQLADAQGHLIRLGGVGNSIPLKENASFSLQMVIRAFHLLALNDALKYAQEILNQHSLGGHPLSDPEQIEILDIVGLIHFFKKEYDLAMSHWQTALSLAQTSNHNQFTIRLMVRIGHVFFEKRDLDHTKNLVLQAKNLARELADEQTYFYAQFLEFLLQEKIREQSIVEFRVFYEDILIRAKSLEFFNFLSYLSTNPFGLYSDYPQEYEFYHLQGIALAKSHHNIFRLACAYQTAGLVSSVKGNYQQTIEYYNKSLELKKKLRNPLELAYINNGIGFYHYMIGNYEKAHHHFLDSIRYLKKAKNFEEIGMTLFNLSVNSLLAFDYENSIFYLRTCQELIRVIKIKHLPYHSSFGIQVVLGTAYALDQQFSKAWQSLLYIEHHHLKPFPRKNEEYFLYHFLQALLNGKKEEWDQAEFFLKLPNDNILYYAPFFYTHYGDYLFEFITVDEALPKWEKGLEFAQKLNNALYTSLLEKRIEAKKPQKIKLDLARSRSGWSWIMAAARLQSHLITIHEQIEGIQFIRTFQMVASQCRNFNELAQKSGDLLYQNSQVHAVYLCHIQKNKIITLYQRGELDVSDPYMNSLLLFLLNSTKKYFPKIPRFNQEPISEWQQYGLWFYQFSPSKDQTVLLVLIIDPETDNLSRQPFQIFSHISSYFEISWNRLIQVQTIKEQIDDLKRKNLLLEKSSTTDQLTGVGNRNALYAALKNEMARINRFKQDQGAPVSILFLDLDNFKFFNDNFGHALGDKILELTANLFQEAVRTTDLVFRYGGDEFVIVLPETSEDGARELANRILKKFTEVQSFRTVLEELYAHNFTIPQDKQLSCSIGIATYTGTPVSHTDYQAFLNQADNNLYQAKVQGRNQAV